MPMPTRPAPAPLRAFLAIALMLLALVGGHTLAHGTEHVQHEHAGHSGPPIDDADRSLPAHQLIATACGFALLVNRVVLRRRVIVFRRLDVRLSPFPEPVFRPEPPIPRLRLAA